MLSSFVSVSNATEICKTADLQAGPGLSRPKSCPETWPSPSRGLDIIFFDTEVLYWMRLIEQKYFLHFTINFIFEISIRVITFKDKRERGKKEKTWKLNENKTTIFTSSCAEN